MSNVTKVIVLAVALAAALTVSGPTQTRAQEAVLLEAGQDSILIALNEQNDSGQSGWATLTAMDDQTEVVLNLSAGDLETELVHIHTGSCGDSLVGVVYGLTSFVDGSGESTTIIDASLASLRTGATAVNSHEADNAGNYTSCGNIPTVGDSITIALNEQNDSAQSGWATLTARGSMTEVVLSISAGDLETELVHIHDGPCDDLGGVVHGLTSFVGGSGGSATLVDASLASLRSGDFAINSHEAGNPGTYTTCGDIPAGETEAILIALKEQNVSGQNGWASLTAKGDQTVVVLNLPAGNLETQAVHIHNGPCNNLGGVVYRLTSFVDGSGFSVTAVDATLASLKTGGFAINSHEADNDGNYTSCVDIPDEDDTVTFALDEQNDSGHSGWATLTARDRMTEIVLHLAPGDLGTELVHIHNGQCGDDLGGVLGGLTSFVNGSGASVTTANATLASLQSGGFAINSHEAGNPGTYTACGNIPASAEGIAAIKAAAAGAGLSSTGDTNLLPVALTALALGFVFFAGGTVLLRRRGSRLA